MAKRQTKRVIMRVEVTPGAINAIDIHRTNTGMTHAATYSRMVQWVAAQDELTQASILGLLPDNTSFDPVETYLKKIVKR